MSDRAESEIRHRGKVFLVETLSWERADGRRMRRDVVRHPGAVVIVPVLGRDRIVLIHNERFAVGGRLWELPAGTLETGEAVAAAAARELEEETGYRAGVISQFASFFTSPGFLDERLHLFIARDLEPGPQRLDEGEEIDVAVFDADEALEMVADGRICDAKTIAGLLMWDRWHRAPRPAGESAGARGEGAVP